MADVIPPIHIGPMLVKVERISADAGGIGGYLGAASVDREHIIIADGQGFAVERATVLHEILHVVTHQAAQGVLSEEDEERYIKAIEFLLLSVLRDNPHLMRYLTKARPDGK